MQKSVTHGPIQQTPTAMPSTYQDQGLHLFLLILMKTGDYFYK